MNKKLGTLNKRKKRVLDSAKAFLNELTNLRIRIDNLWDYLSTNLETYKIEKLREDYFEFKEALAVYEHLNCWENEWWIAQNYAILTEFQVFLYTKDDFISFFNKMNEIKKKSLQLTDEQEEKIKAFLSKEKDIEFKEHWCPYDKEEIHKCEYCFSRAINSAMELKNEK